MSAVDISAMHSFLFVCLISFKENCIFQFSLCIMTGKRNAGRWILSPLNRLAVSSLSYANSLFVSFYLYNRSVCKK